MKNKKIIIIFSLLLILICTGGYFAIKYVKKQKENKSFSEYTPQEEIAQEQTRQTIVSLYFIGKETKELAPEAKLIDIKDIINTPYEKLIDLLIQGPKNEKLEKAIPENTKLLKNYLEGDCLVLDFSEEFLNGNEDEKNKQNKISTIVKTLTELTEVNKIKILINGSENEQFNEIYDNNNLI